MNLLFLKENGFYRLSFVGYIIFFLFAIGCFFLSAFFNKEKKRQFTTKQLVFCGTALSLGFLTSYIKVWEFPWGGSITLFSMLFICLIGYWYGLKIGLITGFAYGILQFLQGGSNYILTPLQVCCDYFFAFTALGLSGIFTKSKNGLIKGYLIGILGRGFFHSIGGYLYWMNFMPENFPKTLRSVYPIVYNYSYILLEGFATIILLSLPVVSSAMKQVKKEAA